jgi:hypothetical protein
MKHEAPHILRQRATRLPDEAWADTLPRLEACKEEARLAILAYARVSGDSFEFLLGIAADLTNDPDCTDMLMQLTEARLRETSDLQEAVNCAENMVDAAIRVRDALDERLTERTH